MRVVEAYTRDVGRGAARIDYDTMDLLGICTGDYISIIGKRTSLLKALPLYPSDEKKGLLRIDGLGRNNTNCAIGHNVKISGVRKELIQYATKVDVVAGDDIPPIDERYLADALEGIPITKGDQLMVPYFGGRLTFHVLDLEPKDTHGSAIINQKTVFTINEGAPPVVSETGEQLTLRQQVKVRRAELNKQLEEVLNISSLSVVLKKYKPIIEELNQLKAFELDVLMRRDRTHKPQNEES